MFHTHRPETRIHFVGIGGIGMSGIAEILINLGYPVSGSDLKESDSTKRLSSLGATIRLGHAKEHLDLLEGLANVVVISSAVKPENPEVAEAKRRGIPVIPRAEMLAELMRLKFGIAIAGSHGKTTTTSLIATVLHHAGLDPTAVIGGKLPQLGSNAKLGRSKYLVAEADESDGSFLHLSPTVAVVTNIDPEHLDHYGNLETLKETFVQFINKVPFYGLAVLCLDHENVQELLPQVQKRYVTYGLTPLAEYRATDVIFTELHSKFRVWHKETCLGEVDLPIPGMHNVLNALAVWAVCDFLHVPFSHYKQALASFQGVGRRFTVRGQVKSIMVVDDYGHHPAEIRATLSGARAGFPDRRLIAIFQPHRYSRTQALFTEFARAFNEANMVVVTDIYPAGETPIPKITGKLLAELIHDYGHRDVQYIGKRSEVAKALASSLKSNDLVITLGAGDIWQTGEEVLEFLRKS